MIQDDVYICLCMVLGWRDGPHNKPPPGIHTSIHTTLSPRTTRVSYRWNQGTSCFADLKKIPAQTEKRVPPPVNVCVHPAISSHLLHASRSGASLLRLPGIVTHTSSVKPLIKSARKSRLLNYRLRNERAWYSPYICLFFLFLIYFFHNRISELKPN
ncbi:hypothetical protein GGR50DRAFT_639213 [Xylaria sp. CBS 124048]|nr:hypothetical protein GGR50DRAFT_639213 [Xylaria sp. CBS 124048]